MYNQRMWDVNKITENLWQGARPPAGGLVAAKGFHALVLAADEHQDAQLYPGVDVILAPGYDTLDIDALNICLPDWVRAAKEVAERVKAGQKVLVTCMAGANRSGFITALALHHLTGWPGVECVSRIKARRPIALCNELFVRYLSENILPKETL